MTLLWFLIILLTQIRAVSSVGRAPALQAGGHQFESDTVHQNMSGFYFTYVLKCCDGKYYIGSSSDLERRLEEHKKILLAQLSINEKTVINSCHLHIRWSCHSKVL